MGEGSEHSQEAMSREVNLLMSITSGDKPTEPPSRGKKRKARKEEPAEAQITTDD
jgi:hypothetical protein